MIKDMMPNAEAMMAPIVKTNKIMVANVEKLVAKQMELTQSYMTIAVDQMKAAAEISNPQDAQSFVKKQMEIATSLRQKIMDDAKQMAEMANSMKVELTELAQENVSEMTKAGKAAAEKATAAVTKSAA